MLNSKPEKEVDLLEIGALHSMKPMKKYDNQIDSIYKQAKKEAPK